MFKSGLYLCLILTEAVMMGKEVQSPRERSDDIWIKTSTVGGWEGVLWVVRTARGDEEVQPGPAGSAVLQLLGHMGSPKWGQSGSVTWASMLK